MTATKRTSAQAPTRTQLRERARRLAGYRSRPTIYEEGECPHWEGPGGHCENARCPGFWPEFPEDFLL